MSEKVLSTAQKAVAAENIKSKKCFACGKKPSTGRGEHVLPLWLQNKHNLHHDRVSLLNATRLPYRQLTIPCCTACNTGFLSQLEREVQAILVRGEISNAVEHLAMGRWLAKIFYGLLVKETSLLRERRYPSLGNILEADFLEELMHCGLIFQTARKPTTFKCFHGPFPFSLYWYRIDEGGTSTEFDLTTNLWGQSIALRSDSMGLVFVNDGGLQLESGVAGPFGLSGAIVTGIQFSELSARIHYKATLRAATHLYVYWESDTSLGLSQESVRPFSGAIQGDGFVRTFDEWNELHFSQVASTVTRLDKNLFFDPASGRIGTLLGNLIDNGVTTGEK